MEFTFLGTSSGIPTKLRNVSGLIIKRDDSKRWSLVDCGEGTQHQLLHAKHSLVQLEAIFITHVHGDHCYGLPGLIATAAMAGRTEDLTIIAPKGIEEYLRTTIACTDMHLPYTLHFVAVETTVAITLKSGLKVTTCALSHRVPCWAYRFDEVVNERHLDVEKLQQAGIEQGPLWGEVLKNTELLLDGQRINTEQFLLPLRDSRSVIVGGDNDTPETLDDIIADVDVLIHEATYTQAVSEKVGPGPMHCSAERIARYAQQRKLPALVLTHFSARYHHTGNPHAASIETLRDEASNNYDGQLFLAQDFASFELSKQKTLRLVNTDGE